MFKRSNLVFSYKYQYTMCWIKISWISQCPGENSFTSSPFPHLNTTPPHRMTNTVNIFSKVNIKLSLSTADKCFPLYPVTAKLLDFANSDRVFKIKWKKRGTFKFLLYFSRYNFIHNTYNFKGSEEFQDSQSGNRNKEKVNDAGLDTGYLTLNTGYMDTGY